MMGLLSFKKIVPRRSPIRKDFKMRTSFYGGKMDKWIFPIFIIIVAQSDELLASSVSKGSTKCDLVPLDFPWISNKPESKEVVGTTFTLFTRNDTLREGTVIYKDKIDELSNITSSSTFKFVIPGYLSSGGSSWVAGMLNVLLLREDTYVIVVNWKSGPETSPRTYFQAVANTRVVGAEVSCFINQLVEIYDVSPLKCHIVCFSLGAHIAGFAGSGIRNLGLIEALDAAGPGFENMPTSVRLDPSDAMLVVSYHTDAKTEGYAKGLIAEFGMMEPVDHIDFYINGGFSPQPGCDCTLWETINGKCDSESYISCSHSRAPPLIIDSYRPNQCQLVGYECPSGYDAFNEGLCDSCGTNMSKCAIVGPLASLNPTRGNNSLKVYLKTNWKSPFCLFHYHVTLALVQPKEAWRYVYGKLSIQLIGDNGELSTEWPDQREKGGDWFYHEKKEKKFIFLNENYIGKIREVKLKWLSIQEFLKASTWYWCASCDYDLFVSSVDIKIMNDPSLFSSNNENRHSFKICLPNEPSQQYAILKSGGSSFSFWESC